VGGVGTGEILKTNLGAHIATIQSCGADTPVRRS